MLTYREFLSSMKLKDCEENKKAYQNYIIRYCDEMLEGKNDEQ